VLSACERCNGGQQVQRTTSILCRSVQQQSGVGEKRENEVVSFCSRSFCLEGGAWFAMIIDPERG
jgi:hypothetical protein